MGLFGGGSSQPSSTTTTQTTTPWSGQEPYYKDIFSTAQNLSNQPLSYYSGTQVAPLNSTQNSALNLAGSLVNGTPQEQQLANLASNYMTGNPYSAQINAVNQNYTSPATNTWNNLLNPDTYKQMVNQAGSSFQNATNMNQNAIDTAQGIYNPASQQLLDTINGKYLNPSTNPYFNDTVNQAMKAVKGQIGSNADQYGAYGGSSYNDALSRNLANTTSQMYGQNYTNERNNQMQALGMSPAVSSLIQNPMQNYSSQIPALTSMLEQPQQYANSSIAGALSQAPNLSTMYQQPYQYANNLQTLGATMVPTSSGLNWDNVNNALNAGSVEQNQAQNEINANMNEYNWNQMEPWQLLSLYQNAIGNSLGGTTTSTQPYYQPSSLGNMASLGALGAGIGKMAGLGTTSTLGMAGGLGLLGLLM